MTTLGSYSLKKETQNSNNQIKSNIAKEEIMEEIIMSKDTHLLIK